MNTASTNSQTIAASLGAMIGPDHLLALDNATAVAPANTEEVAAILRFAHENRLAVVPWGGGTNKAGVIP